MSAQDRSFGSADRSGRDTGASRGELVRSWLVCWGLCAALWLVLDDTVALPELIDGAAAATLGASGATLVRARSHVQFSAELSWVRYAWRPLVRLVSDLPDLVRVLSHALTGGDREPGRVRTVGLALRSDGRARATQVALASIAGSVAPSTVVVAVDENDGRLVFHELTPGEGRERADPLELG